MGIRKRGGNDLRTLKPGKAPAKTGMGGGEMVKNKTKIEDDWAHQVIKGEQRDLVRGKHLKPTPAIDPDRTVGVRPAAATVKTARQATVMKAVKAARAAAKRQPKKEKVRAIISGAGCSTVAGYYKNGGIA